MRVPLLLFARKLQTFVYTSAHNWVSTSAKFDTRVPLLLFARKLQTFVYTIAHWAMKN